MNSVQQNEGSSGDPHAGSSIAEDTSSRPYLGFAVWASLAIIGFALTFTFDTDIPNYRYGPAGWPRAIFILMLVAAGIQLASSLRNRGETDVIGSEQTPFKLSFLFAGLPIAVVATCLVYIILLPKAGFFAATPIMIALVMRGLGATNWLRILMVTAVIYAIILVVFVRFLFVPLPVGSWPGFYDFGTFLITTVR